IAEHTKIPGSGPFRDGAQTGTSYADFDENYDPINGLNYEGAASSITVQEGDRLESIAQNIWGDSSYWYMIADANGIQSDNDLVAGMTLIIPNKIHNAHNNSDTFRPYDPNTAIGNTSPTAPKKHKAPCGVFGQILLVVIAIAITLILKVPIANL